MRSPACVVLRGCQNLGARRYESNTEALIFIIPIPRLVLIFSKLFPLISKFLKLSKPNTFLQYLQPPRTKEQHGFRGRGNSLAGQAYRKYLSLTKAMSIIFSKTNPIQYSSVSVLISMYLNPRFLYKMVCLLNRYPAFSYLFLRTSPLILFYILPRRLLLIPSVNWFMLIYDDP